MDWFSLIHDNVLLIAMGALQFYFICRLTGRELQLRHCIIYLFPFFVVQYLPPHMQSTLILLLELLASYAISRLILKNSPSISCIAVVLAHHVTQLSFGIINPLEFLLFPVALGRPLLMLALVILASLLALAISFFCYKLILKRFSLGARQDEPYIWLLLLPVIFFYAVEFYLLNTTYERVLVVPYPLEPGKHLSILVLQLLGLGALFSALYAYQRTCDSFQAQSSLASLSQETNAQKTYVSEAQLRYEQTRAFRHDVKNYLSVLDGLLKEGSVQQAQAYLQKLDAVTGSLSLPIHTGNAVVDIILRDKSEIARAKGIKTEVSLTLPQSCGTLDDLDLCVVFSNAMDNAVHACTQIDGPKFIRISGERQGGFYMLEFENTCGPEPKQPLGTGLSNVKAVAEKYGGTMTIEKSESRFCLSVLLNISLHGDCSSVQTP